MSFDDDTAEGVLNGILLLMLSPTVIRLYKRGYFIRLFCLVLPLLATTALAEFVDLRGALLTMDILLMGLMMLTIFSGILWSAVKEMADAQTERRSVQVGTLLALLTSCLGLFSTYAQIFSATGIKDTSFEPSYVTHNVLNALYFTVMTWTTVGYGDLLPNGPLARFFAAIAALNGYTVLALLISYFIPVLKDASHKPLLFRMFDWEVSVGGFREMKRRRLEEASKKKSELPL